MSRRNQQKTVPFNPFTQSQTNNSESSIRKQMKSNQFMDERSVRAGESAEKAFDRAIKAKGMNGRNASRYEQRVSHIDRWMSPKYWKPDFTKGQTMKDKPNWSVEIKAMKRISRASPSPQSKWLWVEFKNIDGGPGWLYGEAVFLATEVEEGFYLIPLKSLRSWSELHVDRTAKVNKPQHAKYKSYTRRDRQDEMSLIEFQTFHDWYEGAAGRKLSFFPKVMGAV